MMRNETSEWQLVGVMWYESIWPIRKYSNGATEMKEKTKTIHR